MCPTLLRFFLALLKKVGLFSDFFFFAERRKCRGQVQSLEGRMCPVQAQGWEGSLSILQVKFWKVSFVVGLHSENTRTLTFENFWQETLYTRTVLVLEEEVVVEVVEVMACRLLWVVVITPRRFIYTHPHTHQPTHTLSPSSRYTHAHTPILLLYV